MGSKVSKDRKCDWMNAKPFPQGKLSFWSCFLCHACHFLVGTWAQWLLCSISVLLSKEDLWKVSPFEKYWIFDSVYTKPSFVEFFQYLRILYNVLKRPLRCIHIFNNFQIECYCYFWSLNKLLQCLQRWKMCILYK